MRIMACAAIHSPLIVGAALPVLPAKTRIAMAAGTQFCRAVNWHWTLGMISLHRAVAGFTRNTVLQPGSGGWVVVCHVADQARARLSLCRPLFQEFRIAHCLPMGAVFPF